MAVRPRLHGHTEDDRRHVYDFFSLAGELEAFDLMESFPNLEADDKSAYYGWEGTDRENQILYRTVEGRWVLLFVIMEVGEQDVSPVDRELTPRQAAWWLRQNGETQPRGLPPAPSTYDDSADRKTGQARLDRAWTQQPDHPVASSPSLPSDALIAINVNPPSEVEPNVQSRQPMPCSKADSPAPRAVRRHGTLENDAKAMLVIHPDWTNIRLAEELGCHPKTLSGFKEFRAFRKVLASTRNQIPLGRKNSKTGDIESWENE